MNALTYALQVARKVCNKNGWVFDEDGIGTILEMDLEEQGINHNTPLSTPIKLDVENVVMKWEDLTLENYDEEMRTGSW